MIVRLIKAHRNEIRDELIEADHMNNSDLHFDDAIRRPNATRIAEPNPLDL
jgi:hypothetical protein